ncbi:acetyl-CoA hydrolase/transferase family protein [Halobacteriovorax sp. HLS]|uniref:acetyl-CoA hydrolase/transferase family protein n=1 Tax=Halobacteriovorax sp. HLS TaxID=2234000 RepID=UPI000FD89073|nr:acetyl-CoA hydrolase/transferase C-terminal domain-containing protein [Halobacteriovorax sp. HLS]
MIIHSNFNEVFKEIRDYDSVVIHGGMATPTSLLESFKEYAKVLKGIEIMHLHTHGNAFWCSPEYKDFRVTNFFVGANVRKSLDYDRVDYLPCFLSEIPNLISSGVKKVDIVFIHVSPPDKHGYCTLGTSLDIMQAATSAARVVIAQINPNVPKVHGDAYIHVSKIHHAIEVTEELHTVKESSLSNEELRIGKNIAEIIEDGSTLQMGIGSIPDAVLKSLDTHKDLGIHTEMWSDQAMHLMKKGVVNNKLKKVHQGKTVGSFIMGSQDVLDFVDDNPETILIGADYVNNPSIIRRNPKVVAINSAIEIDLTGQVCADSIGHSIYSGVGGQMDFIRGASLSTGGKPIIAITSRTKKGTSKIIPTLKPGAGVVTTRAHVHYVATEHGVTNLYGLTLKQRAQELIRIAHPDDRETLSKQWHELFKKRP